MLSAAGILVIMLYCVFTFTSIALFPGPFNPVNNWLSDLGNSSFSPKGALFYNVGCVLTGLALFPFFAGFYKWYTKEKRRKLLMVITQAVGFIAAFALIMIGVFSEDYVAQHMFWSQVFFIFNLVVLILANVSLMIHPKFIRPIGYYGLVVAVINLLFVVFYNTPILEWFTVFTALGYVALLAYNTFRLPMPL
ncbi:DUF998 domain-containing protein [[Eubacterium] cellulosolvens]